MPNQAIDEDTDTGPIQFTISDAETAAGSLTVTATSDNQALVSNANIVLGGSDQNRAVKVTPVSDEFGTAGITLRVGDGSAEATDAFTLTPPPNRSGNITVKFSKPMNPDTLMQNPSLQPSTSTTILLFRGGPASTTQVPAKVGCADASCRTVTLDSDGRLGKRKRYTVRFEGAGDTDGLAVKDPVGNELAQDEVKSFRVPRR